MRHAVLALTLTLCTAGMAAAQAGSDTAPIRTTPFPDVPRDHWAFDAVESLRQKGIVRGYPPAQTFSPASARRVQTARKPASKRKK